jgi:hypothetical protein
MSEQTPEQEPMKNELTYSQIVVRRTCVSLDIHEHIKQVCQQLKLQRQQRINDEKE